MRVRPHRFYDNYIHWGYTNFVLPWTESYSYQGLGRRMELLVEEERLSPKAAFERQWNRVLKMLAHAAETSPFYQKRFAEAGVRVERIQSPEDLKAIPPLTRDDLRTNLEEIYSRKFRREDLMEAATGGTTDTPVPILRSPESLRWKSAVQWCLNAWAGMRPGDKVFYLWGARQDYSENPSWKWRLYDRHLMRRVYAPTSLFNEEVLETYRVMMNDLRPRIVYAYPTPLALFCEYLQKSKREFHHPASVICTAEPLLPAQRRIIEEVLECPLFEHYGSREFSMIAGECEAHAGMHVNPCSAFLEYLPLEGLEDPDLREVLVTDLMNDGMPLIRYRANDCVIPESTSCSCGRGFPLIQRVVGRTADLFVLANGDKVPGVSLTNRVLKVCPGLKKVQIVQQSLDRFLIRYVPGPGYATGDIDMLRVNLRRFLPEDLNWAFEEVAEIPRERSGKTRFCISLVKSPLAPEEAKVQS